MAVSSVETSHQNGSWLQRAGIRVTRRGIPDCYSPHLISAMGEIPFKGSVVCRSCGRILTDGYKLMLQTAPVLMLFQPTIGPDAKLDGQAIRYDFQGEQSAEQIHSWISRHLPAGPRPPLIRPFNYVGLLTTTTLVLGLITFVTVAKPYVLPVIQNRNLWAGISLIAILLFTSGHMFNHIRKVPYVSSDGKGGISYFAGGFSSQFGMETQIVAAMCKITNVPYPIPKY